MKEREPRPMRMTATLNVWRCDDLKDVIKDTIRAHVKDVEVARQLEEALGIEIAYGDGGGDPVALT